MKAIFTDNIFRGYDIRAKVPEELNSAGAYVIGRAYGTYLAQRRINQAVVVNDNRLSAQLIKTAFVNGLLDTGINVIDHGLGLVYSCIFPSILINPKAAFLSLLPTTPKNTMALSWQLVFPTP